MPHRLTTNEVGDLASLVASAFTYTTLDYSFLAWTSRSHTISNYVGAMGKKVEECESLVRQDSLSAYCLTRSLQQQFYHTNPVNRSHYKEFIKEDPKNGNHPAHYPVARTELLSAQLLIQAL